MLQTKYRGTKDELIRDALTLEFEIMAHPRFRELKALFPNNIERIYEILSGDRDRIGDMVRDFRAMIVTFHLAGYRDRKLLRMDRYTSKVKSISSKEAHESKTNEKDHVQQGAP